MKISDLKIGDILINKNSKIKYCVAEFINEDVVLVNNLKFSSMTDYINNNIIDEFERIKIYKI